jgi:hypothetical protein
MQDAADDPSVVDTEFAGVAMRQVRLDPRLCFIREPQQPGHRDPSAPETPNSGRKRKRQHLTIRIPYPGIVLRPAD